MKISKALWVIGVIDCMFLLMAYAAYEIHGGFNAQFGMTVMLGTFGVLAGWLVGTLSSPTDKKEEVIFAKYAALVSSFISGYLISKIDKLVTNISSQVLVSEVYGLRTMVFLSCFISGVLLMYFFRSYLSRTAPI